MHLAFLFYLPPTQVKSSIVKCEKSDLVRSARHTFWLAARRARAAHWRHNNPPCWAEGRQQRRSLLPLPVAPLYFFSLHSTRCRHRRLRRHFRLLSSMQLAITPRSLHGPSPNLRPCPKSNARICSSHTNTTCLYAGRYRRSALGRMC